MLKRTVLFACLALLSLAFAQSPVFAQANVILAWDHDGNVLTGFEMVVCPAANQEDLSACQIHDVADPAARSFTLVNQPVGVAYVRARAYNTGVPATLKAYSGFSNEVMFSVPAAPTSPSGLNSPGGTIAMNFTLPSDRNAVVTVALEKIP